MNDTDLHDLLHRATDAVERPSLASTALRTARRRRTRRRGAAAAVLSSAVVVTVVVATHLGGGASVAPPPTGPSVPTSTTRSDQPRPVRQPEWDPRGVDDLPAAPDDVAPLLPDVVEPPATAPLLTEEPVGALLLAVEGDDAALVLSAEGEWRSVPLLGRYSHVALSPRGTRLVVESAEHDVVVHDVASGESHPLAAPAGLEPWDYTRWAWLDEETLLVDDLEGGWRVSAADGEATEVAYPTQFAWAVDPDGWVVESAEFGGPADFTDWAGGEPRTVSMAGTGRLQSVRAGTATIAGTSYDDRTFSVVVADRGSLSPTYVLPVNDHEGNYSGGGLGVVALADDGTVLLRVADYDRPFSSRILAWHPASDTLERVASVNTRLRVVRYAEGLIGDDAP